MSDIYSASIDPRRIADAINAIDVLVLATRQPKSRGIVIIAASGDLKMRRDYNEHDSADNIVGKFIQDWRREYGK